MKEDKALTYGRGERLTRTDVLTVRIDPRLNYLLEIAARFERRTKSSFAECVLEEAVTKKLEQLGGEVFGLDGRSEHLALLLWHPEPWCRLQILAERFPEAMTVQDEETWSFLNNAEIFWNCSTTGERHLDSLLLRDLWAGVYAVISGQLPVFELIENARRIKALH